MLGPVYKDKCSSSRDVIALSLATLFCLAPFLHKAFHIDDPLFLWAARHILSHPLDFYGFSVNWYGYKMPMSAVAQNPPLASYYIAAVANFVGWKEVGLHAAFLLPALAAVTGTYYVARELCIRPVYAVLACLMTPVFLVSGTSVMCDMMMLSFWIWAVFFWMRGLKTGSVLSLTFASLLIAACSLTKYFGISLVPLLFAYALTRERRLGLWTLLLLIPLAVLFVYQIFTYRLYGTGLFTAASSYAINHENLAGAHLLLNTLIGLSFTGGCYITVLFCSFHLWRRRTLVLGALMTMIFLSIVLLVLLVFSTIHGPSVLHFYKHHVLNWPLIIQCYVFSLVGVAVLCLAATDLWHSKDADSLLLFLWITGTFVFASYLNWSVNGRSVLPMAPAMGILIFRRIQTAGTTIPVPWTKHFFLPLVPALIVALWVTYADYKLANTARSEADMIAYTYPDKSATLRFEGHWGFQYYMEEHGYKPLNCVKTHVTRGDLVVIPPHNINLYALHTASFSLVDKRQTSASRWITTMSRSLGAGFYSSQWGPLPFAIGRVPEEKYYVFMAKG